MPGMCFKASTIFRVTAQILHHHVTGDDKNTLQKINDCTNSDRRVVAYRVCGGVIGLGGVR